MTTPLVSVVIPTYNQPGYLLEALDSVFAQTFEDYEVVIINDGSTDDTLTRLEPLIHGPHGHRLRVITQANAGIGAARNRGLDEAHGRYVAFMDHDDLWKPAKLARQVELFRTHPGCSVVSAVWASTKNPQQPIFDYQKTTDEAGLVARPLQHLAQCQLIVTTSAMMVDREKARGVRFATRRDCIEDTPFQIGLFGRGEVAIAGPEILVLYREHGENYSKRASFFYNGLRMLRRMDREGAFTALVGEHRRDLRDFLAMLARFTALKQISGGCRWRGAGLYLTEFPAQLRRKRIRFLASYPVLLVLPRAIIRRFQPLP